MSEFITIDDGSKEYVFKNKLGEEFAKFSFNPTDPYIIKRFENVQEYMSSVSVSDSDDTAGAIVKLNEDIAEQFNVLCGKDVSGLFTLYAPLTLFANGDFYCEVVLEKIGDFIESELNVRFEKKKAKIKKALGK